MFNFALHFLSLALFKKKLLKRPSSATPFISDSKIKELKKKANKPIAFD